jgi:hypothetical protein
MTPQEIKTTKIVVGGIAGLTILYFLFFNTDNGGGKDDPTGNGTGNGGNVVGTFNAKNVANDLLEAMRNLGTDEDTIIGILRYVNPTQFNAVFSAFGSQQYNATLGNQLNPLAWVNELPFVNLKGWLKSELSPEEYLNLKRKYPTKL